MCLFTSFAPDIDDGSKTLKVKRENNMSDFIERLQEEYLELNIKRVKLLKFIESDEYKKIDITDQTLLAAQEGAMTAYLNVLGLRGQLNKNDQDDNDYANIGDIGMIDMGL